MGIPEQGDLSKKWEDGHSTSIIKTSALLEALINTVDATTDPSGMQALHYTQSLSANMGLCGNSTGG